MEMMNPQGRQRDRELRLMEQITQAAPKRTRREALEMARLILAGILDSFCGPDGPIEGEVALLAQKIARAMPGLGTPHLRCIQVAQAIIYGGIETTEELVI